MMICLGTRQKIAPIKEKPLAHARAKESSRNIRRGQTSIKPSDNVWRPDQICQSEHHIPYLTLFSQPPAAGLTESELRHSTANACSALAHMEVFYVFRV